ncbi:POK9 protein, partial [Poecile atricapillus]|nr:POK9 protein [Poecile atricapillus]
CLPLEIGKRESQREKPLHQDTNSSCQNISATSLQPATAGSLSLDLAASVTVDLLTSQPYKIPTGIIGPVMINGKAMGAIVLGHSSASLMGLFILPGVIDVDYSGEIYIMAYTLAPPTRIDKGQRIAQLVPLPQYTHQLTPLKNQSRGTGGFGSTGELTLLTLDLNTRPKRTVVLNYNGESHQLEGLLDTGADSSIVAPQYWPQEWPLLPSMVTVTGMGGLTLAKRSPQIQIQLDGKVINSVLSVVPLPDKVQCLIGRDILSQLGVIL